jgi:hypothetical protein
MSPTSTGWFRWAASNSTAARYFAYSAIDYVPLYLIVTNGPGCSQRLFDIAYSCFAVRLSNA